MPHYDVLIVGSGHAGAQAAIALRQAGFEGALAIVGDETEPPYERPPLSKDYFSGEKDFERILLRPLAFWAERHVDLLAGRRVVLVDSESRSVQTAAGETLSYGRLIWAAGCAPRRLTCPGADLAGVHVVRTRADADAIMAAMPTTEAVAIIGGGYIGLEAAAVLSKAGKTVTVVEAQSRVLARVAAEPLSRFYETQHRAHGVDIRLDAALEEILGDGGRVTSVRLADGAVIPAQTVIVGIGVAPAVEALKAEGAAGDNGVDVDAFCRTSLPGVYAIGDCAAHVNLYGDGRRLRVESVQNAVDQATTAARHIMGAEQPYDAVPWFWSNQYDLRLQTVGLSTGYDAVVVRGEIESSAFSLIYLRDGEVIALDCINSTKDYVQGRKLVVGRAKLDHALVADATRPLNDPGLRLSER